MSSKNNRLDFKVAGGIANGYTVIWTNECFEQHKTDYGHIRTELNDNNFIDNSVVNAIKNPDAVYSSTKQDSSGKIVIRKRQYVFYKENSSFVYNSKEIKYYIKVAVVVTNWFSKSMEIMTALYTDRIPEKNRCKPVSNI